MLNRMVILLLTFEELPCYLMYAHFLIDSHVLGDRESDEEIDFREIQHHFTDDETGIRKGQCLRARGPMVGSDPMSLWLKHTALDKKKKKSYLSFSFVFHFLKCYHFISNL